MKKIMFNDKYGLTKAVLEGRKTMTRRSVPEKLIKAIEGGVPGFAVMESRYKVGEVVAVAQSYKEINLTFMPHQDAPDFKKLSRPARQWGNAKAMAGWTNKMFVCADLMPHQIRITNVRVERLQDISDEDCLREGIRKMTFDTFSFDSWKFFTHNPREAFAALIAKVSGKGIWESNPWVYAYEFELVKED